MITPLLETSAGIKKTAVKAAVTARWWRRWECVTIQTPVDPHQLWLFIPDTSPMCVASVYGLCSMISTKESTWNHQRQLVSSRSYLTELALAITAGFGYAYHI